MASDSFLKVVFKNIWIIIITTIICLGVSVYADYFYLTPQYTANTSLLVLDQVDIKGEYINNELTGYGMLIKDYKEIITSRSFLKKVKSDLMIDTPSIKKLSIDDIASKISVVNKTDTRIMDIGVSDKEPKLTAKIANMVAQDFKIKAAEILKMENVTIIDEATVPDSPSSPNPKRDIPLAAFVGILCGMGIIYIKNTLSKGNTGEVKSNGLNL